MALIRVRMTRCLEPEPAPPTEPELIEAWCAAGNSARPVQEHVGDFGDILWVNPGESLCVHFEDGDERLLFREEVTIARKG